MKYSVLTVQQPWAYLLCAGIKTVEVRHWPTDFRGDLLIHAAKRTDWDTEQMEYEPWRTIFDESKLRALEYGCIIGRVTVTDCKHTNELTPSNVERALGDFTNPKRFGWVCVNPVLFVHSYYIDGQPGIWQVEINDHKDEAHDKATYEEAVLQKKKMVNKILWLGYQMGYDMPRVDKPDQKYMTRARRNWENINAWLMSKHSAVHKPLDKMSIDELRKVVTQFEQVYKTT